MVEMDIDSLVKWGQKEWNDYWANLPDSILVKKTNRSKKKIIDCISKAISSNLGESIANWVSLFMRTWEDEALSDGTFLRTLKPFQHTQLQIQKTQFAINKIINHNHGFSIDLINKLVSIRNYLAASILVRKNESMICFYFKNNPSAYTFLLQLVEDRFISSSGQKHTSLLGAEIILLTKEELTSIVSYFTVRMAERNYLTNSLFLTRNGDCAIGKIPFKLMVSVYKFYELEADLFKFRYSIDFISKNCWKINCHNPIREMARDFGYFNTDALSQKRQVEWNEHIKNSPSFVDLVSNLKSIMENDPRLQPFQLVGSENSLRIAIPEPLLQIIGKDLLAETNLFREEYLEILNGSYESYAKTEDLANLELSDSFSIMDLIKCNRIVKLFALLRCSKLAKLSNEIPTSYRASLLAAFKEDGLQDILRLCGIDGKSIENYIKIISWTNSSEPAFLDIQYTPILNIDNISIALLSTLLYSNLIRNCMITTQARLFSDGREDPLSETIQHEFDKLEAQTKLGIKYSFNNIEGDIDLLVIWDEQVFIFESKNTLLPCNTNEARTFYDYLDKASTQLDKIVTLFRNSDFCDYLSNKTGLPISTDLKIHTCIVPSIRLSSGINHAGHPVRHGWELANFLCDGKMKLKVHGNDLVFDLYKGNKLEPALLIEYLSEHSPQYTCVWNAYSLSDVQYSGSNWVMTHWQCSFDGLKLIDNLISTFPTI